MVGSSECHLQEFSWKLKSGRPKCSKIRCSFHKFLQKSGHPQDSWRPFWEKLGHFQMEPAHLEWKFLTKMSRTFSIGKLKMVNKQGIHMSITLLIVLALDCTTVRILACVFLDWHRIITNLERVWKLQVGWTEILFALCGSALHAPRFMCYTFSCHASISQGKNNRKTREKRLFWILSLLKLG